MYQAYGGRESARQQFSVSLDDHSSTGQRRVRSRCAVFQDQNLYPRSATIFNMRSRRHARIFSSTFLARSTKSSKGRTCQSVSPQPASSESAASKAYHPFSASRLAESDGDGCHCSASMLDGKTKPMKGKTGTRSLFVSVQCGRAHAGATLFLRCAIGVAAHPGVFSVVHVYD